MAKVATQKYQSIFRELRDDIVAGRYGSDRPFPSEAALMRRFAVSRHTVLRALRELQAQGLVRRRQGAGTFLTRKARETRRLALIIHGSSYCEIFSPIAREVSHLCQARGYALLLGDVEFPDPRKRAARVIELVREYVKQGVDGVIFQPIELLDDARSLNEEVCSIFDAAEVPVVLLDSDITPSPGRSKFDLVGINHFEAGRRMADHLRAVGARRVAYLMQANRAPCVQDRWQGLKFGCEGLPLAAKPLLAEPDDLSAVRAFLRRNRPDAIARRSTSRARKSRRRRSTSCWRGSPIPRFPRAKFSFPRRSWCGTLRRRRENENEICRMHCVRRRRMRRVRGSAPRDASRKRGCFDEPGGAGP